MDILEIKALDYAKDSLKRLVPQKNRHLDLRELYPLDLFEPCLTAQEIQEFKKNWELFLHYLDNFWNQLNAFAKHSIDVDKIKESIMGYLGSVNKARTADSLLVYLDKARNSAQHSLWQHTRATDEREIISDAPSENISLIGNQLIIGGKDSFHMSELVILQPKVILLKSITICDERTKKINTVPLPSMHLNEFLPPLDMVIPQIVAKKAIIYYFTVFEEFKRRIAVLSKKS